MNRAVILCLFVLLGFLIAFAHASPKVRGTVPGLLTLFRRPAFRRATRETKAQPRRPSAKRG